MRFFINKNNERFVYFDDATNDFITSNVIERDLTEITEDEYNELLAIAQTENEIATKEAEALVEAKKDTDFLEKAIKWGLM